MGGETIHGPLRSHGIPDTWFFYLGGDLDLFIELITEQRRDLLIVDVLADKSKGYEAVDEYIRKHKHIANGMRAIQKVKQFYDPITYKELMGITQIWVEAALQLSDKDIRVMQRLVKAQDRSIDPGDDVKKNHVLRTKQDRRFAKHNVSFPLPDSTVQTIPFDRRKTKRRKSDNWQLADKAQAINPTRGSGHRDID